MKQTRKILIALLVVATLLMSMATLFVSAASQPEMLYLTPNANWKVDNARFAAYFFGNGETWVSMSDSNGDGVYEVAVPTDKVYPNVIFCRMNPSAAANNWNNKWNQTADLTIPTNGTNHFTVKEGTWDKGGGTWSTMNSTCSHVAGPAATCTTDQVCTKCGDTIVSALGHSYNTSHNCTRCGGQASFTVAGTGAHLGTEWDTTNTANDMTYADGVYTKVYTNVAAGSYKFKVARDHDWGTAYPSADKSFTVSKAGSTVTITLKGTAVTVTVEAPHVHSYVNGVCSCGDINVTALSGAGTEADPYLVNNIHEFTWFRDQVNAGNSYDNMYIKLTADIDLAGIDWAPIGGQGAPFNGMFDGDNHVISNLTINGSKSYVSGGANDNYKGLFGYMQGGNDAGIKNITLNNAKVTGCLYVGTILGRSYIGGIIENCHVKGLVQVDSYSYAGGIVGRHEYSSGKNVNGDVMSIFNCTVDGIVLTRSGSSDSFINADYAVSYVGGIVGFMAEGNYVIDGCSAANVSVQGTYGVGGISGIAHYGNTISNAAVENIKVVSVNNDPTSNRTGNVGLIAGAVQGTASEPSVFENVTVTNTTGSVTYTDETTSAINANFGNNMNGSKPVVIKTLSGSGTEADPFIIADVDDLLIFRDSVNAGETKYNASGVYVALGANIDLAGIDWSVNIGDDCNATFDGIFDGKGYTISNLTATETAAKADGYVCAGLFGAIYGGAVIKNLVLENVTINTGSFTGNNVGAVVGFVYNGTGSIENVTVRGDINISSAGVYGVGVIVGYSYYNKGFEINNCKVVANAGSSVTAVSGVGGIIGYTNGDVITNCEVSGLSIGATAIAGGISGTTLNVTVDNVSIKDVSIAVSGEYWVNSTGVVAGCFSDNKVNISNVTSENVTGAIRVVGSAYTEKPTAVVPAAAARIGGAYYTSIADAISAAIAGDTVYVLAGTYAIPTMKAGITIEGDGEVLFEGTLSGTLENLTLKNIHIKGANAQRWAYAKGNLVFENVTFEATSVYALHFDGIAEGTNLLYKNCTIIGWAAMGGSPASCVFDGCTIKGNGSYGVIRTYFDATIENCTFDISNTNPDDVYQDGIHSVEATVTVNNCTNANGAMTDIIHTSNGDVAGYVILDGEIIHSHTFDIKGDTVGSTCTTEGYTSYSCICGESEKRDIVAATGHKDTGLDAKCDTCSKYFVPTSPFKLEIYQHNKKATYYFKGSMSGYYFATTSANSLTGAVDVYAEEVDGGYYLYFLTGTTKNYLYIQINGSYTNIKYGSTKAVWAFNESFGTFTTVVNGTTYYMGTYSTYVTISASKISYLSTSNMDKSQFPVRPVSLVDHVCNNTTVTKTVAPTCIAQGYTVYKCNDCAQSFNANYVDIDPTAHSFKNGSIFCSLCDALHPDWVSVDNNEDLAAYAKIANTKICLEAGTYSVPSLASGVHIYGNGEVLLEGTLSGTLDSITLENLYIKGANAQRWAYAKGDLVFNNVTFEATSIYALHFDGITAGATLLYKDCTIIGWAAMSGSPESCVFDGCTIKGNGSYGLIRTYFDATIENCTFDVSNTNTDDVYQEGIHAVDSTITVDNCTNVNGDMKDIIDTSNVGYVVLDGETIHIHKYEDFVCPCGYEFRASIGEVEYPTISAAIEAAVDGDVITILPGVHTEEIKHSDLNRFGGKNITIEGSEDGTTLTGGLYIGYDDNNPYTGSVIVKNIKFEGKGVSLVQLDSVSVIDCEFSNITENAIFVISDSLTNSITITGNVIDGANMGIRVRNALELLIDGNEISNTQHNGILAEHGSAHNANTYPLTITNNTLKNWGLSGEGRAIRIALGKVAMTRTGSTATSKNVTIANNILIMENAPEEFVKMTDVDTSMTVVVEDNVFEGSVPAGSEFVLLEGTGADSVDTSDNAAVTENQPHIKDGNWWIGSTDTGVKAEAVDGHTPVIEIIDGNWHIDGVDTGVKAQGEAGHSPVISIGNNGNWHIDDVDTGVRATPIDGVNGDTPSIGDNGNWFIGDVDTGVKAEGADGHTPVITIQEVNGVKYWFIDGENQNVKAEGLDGHTPVIEIKDDKWYIDGVESGWALVYVVSVDKTATNGLVDTWTITYNNGDKFEFTVTNGETGATGNGIKDVKVEEVEGGKKVIISFTDESIADFEFTIADGTDGDTPVIEIIDGYWHINGENTGIMAVGQPGRPGVDGQDGIDGDKGEDGNDNNQVVITAIAIAAGCIILSLGVLLFWRVRRRSWWCIH